MSAETFAVLIAVGVGVLAGLVVALIWVGAYLWTRLH